VKREISWAILLIMLLLTTTNTTLIDSASANPIIPPLNPDSWTTKATMHESRGRLGVAVVTGKIYAIGGDNGAVVGMDPSAWAAGTTAIVDTNEEYDPETDTWTLKMPMPTARSHFGIAVYENKIYCIGGQTRLNNSQHVTGVNEVYDPATDTWENKAPMPVPGRFQMANAVNNKIIVIGAVDNILNQEYDPETDSWTNNTKTPYQIWSCASAAYDDKLYFVGSLVFSPAPSILIYEPSLDSWGAGQIPPSYLSSASAGVTSGLNAPRRIYFFDENATYVYDPESNAWSAGSGMPKARGYAGVAAVNDTFFVVGGVTLPDGFGEMAPTAFNEQYVPFGYGAVQSPQEPFPTVPVLIIIVAAIVVAGAGFLLIRKRGRGKTQ
jgi:Kelch motif